MNLRGNIVSSIQLIIEHSSLLYPDKKTNVPVKIELAYIGNKRMFK